MAERKPGGLARFTLYFAFFIDLMGYAVVLPIFAPLFLASEGSWLASYPFELRVAWFGLLLTIYAFAQWIGAPRVAALTSTRSSKQIISLGLAVTSFAYLVVGFGLLHRSLALIFVGRFLGGFATGSSALAASSIQIDQSDREMVYSRPWGIIAGGLGLCVGPLVAGVLADEAVLDGFHDALPFWIMSALALINILFVAITIPGVAPQPWTSTKPIKRMAILISTLRRPQTRVSFVALFCFLFGWYELIHFTSAYLFLKFDLSESAIGFTFAAFGALWSLAALIFSMLPPRFVSQIAKQIFVIVLATSLLCFATLLADGWLSFALGMGALVIVISFVWTHFGTFFSDAALSDIRVELSNIFYASSTVASLSATLVGGAALLFANSFPILLASISLLICSILLFVVRHSRSIT